MAKKKTQLVDLSINEVSGVDKAANMRTFLVVKSANASTDTFKDKLTKAAKAFGTAIGIVKEDGGAMDMYAVLQEQTAMDNRWDRHDTMYDLFYPLMESIDSICEDATCTDKTTAVKTSLQQFSDLMISSGIIKSTDYTDSLKKFSEEFAQITDPAFIEKSKFSIDDTHLQAMQLCVDMVKQAVEALPGKVNSESKGGEDDMKPEEIKKAVDEAVAKAVETATTTLQKENTDLKESLATLKKSQDEQLMNIQKSAHVAFFKDLKGLEGDDVEMGAILFKCSVALEKADFEKLQSVLKTANERIVTGDLLKEVGAEGEGSESTDVVKQVEAAAAELRKADASLTKEQAFTKALSNDPKLYAAYSRR